MNGAWNHILFGLKYIGVGFAIFLHSIFGGFGGAGFGTATVTTGNSYPTSSYSFSDNDIINSGDLNLITTYTGIRSATDTVSLQGQIYNVSTTAYSLVGSGTSSTTVQVSHGGTGTSILTLNNVLLGNGTSSVQLVAPGASGNYLISNGTTWQSQAASSTLLVSVPVGDTINTGESVYVSDGSDYTPIHYLATLSTDFAIPILAGSCTDPNAEALAVKFTTRSTSTFNGITVVIGKQGTPSGGVTFQLRPDNGGSPSSTILSSSTVGDGSIPLNTGGAQFYVSPFTPTSGNVLTASTSYWVIATTTSAQSNSNNYLFPQSTVSQGTTKGECAGTWSSFTESFTWALRIAANSGSAYPASGATTSMSNAFIGFNTATGTQSSTISVNTGGPISTFSGLTNGKQYYLANAIGTVSSTAGVVTRKVGISTSSSTLLITNIW